MEIKTNGDFNKIQINFSQDKTADGKIIKEGILVSIREDSVKDAFELYKELIGKLEGKEEKPKKKSKKDKTEEKPEGVETPTCDCGNLMILKNGKWGSFWSCSSYPLCRLTKPYQKAEKVPCDEDLVEVPF